MSTELPQWTRGTESFDVPTLDLVPAAVIASDPDWRIVAWNRAAERLLGWSNAEAMGRSTLELLVAAGEVERIAEVVAHVRSGESWQGALDLRDRDGRAIPSRIVFDPMLDGDRRLLGAVAVVIGSDTQPGSGPGSDPSGRSAAERLADLATIADSALAHLDLESLLHELLARVRDRLRADTATILLVTDEGSHLGVRASLGRDGEVIERLRIPIGRGIAGRIAAANRPLRFDDLSREEVIGEDLRERMRSVIGAPLVAGGRTIGVLHVGSSEPRHFADEDQPLVELAAERAAVALETWRLYQAEQQARMRWESAARRLGRLGVVIARLATRVTEGDVIEAVVAEAMPFLEATGLWIYRLDDGGDALTAVAVHGYPPHVEERFRTVPMTADRPSVRSVRSGEPVFVTSGEELVTTFPDFRGFAESLRAGAAAALPLTVDERPFGVLVLQWDESRAFDDEERSFLIALADQVAQALERTRLYEAERDARAIAEAAAFRTAVLQDITSRLSAALTVDDVAQALIERALEAVGAVAGSAFVLTADEEALEVLGDIGYPPDVITALHRIPVDADLPAALAFRTREPVILCDVASRDAAFPSVRGIMSDDHALVAIPLVAGARGVGAIGLTFGEPRTFGRSELAFMTALADQCALALERARLHDLESRDRKRAAFLDALGELLARSLNYERTLSKIARLAVHGVDAGDERIDGLADLCMIDLVGDDGIARLAAVEHEDPDRVHAVRAVRDRRPIEMGVDFGVAKVLRTGRSELIPRIPLDRRVSASGDSAFEPILPELGVTSSITVPLAARGRTFGAIGFLCEDEERSYSADDLRFAEDVAARASIAIDNARLYRERAEIARTLQRALRPQDPPEIAGVEIATRYLAAGEGVEVGGDFYEIWDSEDGGLWLAIGDVTGKGPSAVDLNVLARHTIRTAAMRSDRPAAILRTLNDALLQRGSGERFCTVAICRLDVSSQPIGVTVASGGHPLPMVLRWDGSVERIGTPGTLLGMFDGIEVHEDRDAALGAGDALVLYTDGVIEERRGAAQFGTDGLIRELERHAGASSEDLAAAIEWAVRAFRPGGELLDDVALVVVRASEQTAVDA